MSDLTIAMLKEHVETDLSDAAIQRLIDSAEEEIVAKFGAKDSAIEVFNEVSLSHVVFLPRRASSITSVSEDVIVGGDITTTDLEADDYRLELGGRALRRLSSGSNPRSRWGDQITVTYVPESDANRRLDVTIDLVKLAIQYKGLDSEKVGDYSATMSKYEAKRAAALNRLTSWGMA